MWVILALCSALLLGGYDICKKRSLTNNSIVGVLTLSVTISSLILLPLLLLGKVPETDLHGHLMICIKSTIVLSSWLCAYIAVKHLPLSIVSPMQASRPMWTLLGALVIFHEMLNGWQWAGIGCALGSVFIFSFAVKHENKTEKVNAQYYIFLILAILIGSCSGLYDKYIMRQYDHLTVQVYYNIYQAAIMWLIWLVIGLREHTKGKIHKLEFRWEIIGISVLLTLSDYVYLLALQDPNSLIAVVSTIRRAGTIIPFFYGIIILHEKQSREKILCLCGILIGLILLLIGSL